MQPVLHGGGGGHMQRSLVVGGVGRRGPCGRGGRRVSGIGGGGWGIAGGAAQQPHGGLHLGGQPSHAGVMAEGKAGAEAEDWSRDQPSLEDESDDEDTDVESDHVESGGGEGGDSDHDVWC